VIANRIESFAKYAGLATVCVEWLALILYYINMPSYFGGQYPISYFATLPQTKLIFMICYTLAGIFSWIFIRHHVSKYYQTPVKIFGVSMLFFIGLAIIPYNPDNAVSDTIHRTVALTSSFLFATGMFLIAKHAHNKLVSRVTFFSLIISFFLLVGFLTVPKTSPFIFALEAGSWLIWQFWYLWMSFYNHKYKVLK
jgi:hypothetical protein